jgi:hypothetical protein
LRVSGETELSRFAFPSGGASGEEAGLDEYSVIESLESVFDPQVGKKIVCGDEAPISDLEARLPGI